jgi:hypothetical protein
MIASVVRVVSALGLGWAMVETALEVDRDGSIGGNPVGAEAKPQDGTASVAEAEDNVKGTYQSGFRLASR